MNEEAFEPVEEDFKILVSFLITGGRALTFAFTGDRQTSHIVTIAPVVQKLGSLPWGGRVEGMSCVSLRRRGSEFFQLFKCNSEKSEQVYSSEYVDEKLGLQNRTDAAHIASLLNGIIRELGKIGK